MFKNRIYDQPKLKTIFDPENSKNKISMITKNRKLKTRINSKTKTPFDPEDPPKVKTGYKNQNNESHKTHELFTTIMQC